MQFRQLISFVCLCAVVCILTQPVAALADNATTYYNAGELLLEQGQLERAIIQFDKALAENTTMMEKAGTIIYIYNDKSGALIDLGKYTEAVATANQGLAIDSTYPGLWNNKGYALYKLGKYQEAITAYDRAISINASIPKYLINKGDALYDSGRYQDAIDAYTKALTADPGNAQATEGLARAQQKAATISPTIIIIVIAIIAIGGGAAYYLLKGKTNGNSTGEKTSKKK